MDALLQLRDAITKKEEPQLSSIADATQEGLVQSLAEATHLQFNYDNVNRTYPLNEPTRFITQGSPVDLRSIYFAWLERDATLPVYISDTERLNQELETKSPGTTVQNLQLVQRLDLIAWLQGQSDESDYIKALDQDAAAAQAAGSAAVASGAAGGVATVSSANGTAAKGPRQVDPRLLEIYSAERGMGDHNSILRGIKPTDFSHVRKHAAPFLSHSRSRTSAPIPAPQPSLPTNLRKPTRRLEPIILLSPSASSLLRLSNARSLLSDGLYIPADSSVAASSASILHIQRLLPSIDPSRPLRFILVDSTSQFKPDYWQRVVAVFTTGQAWQFKSYKWTQPMELFSHALGIYVGWRGEDVPQSVKGWGRAVVSVGLDKMMGPQQSRYRDREVMEFVWSQIEEHMRMKGWGKQ